MNYFRMPYSDLLEAVREAPLHPERMERELPVAVSSWSARQPGRIQVVPSAGAFLDLRDALIALETAWAREHHMGGVSLHGATRKRALTPVVFKAMFDRVRNRLQSNTKTVGLLEVATLEFLNLVTGNKPTATTLTEPFDSLIGSYTYGGYHKMAHDERGGDAPDSGAIVIDAVAALAYATHQVMTCNGLLPEALVQSVACVYGEASANRSKTGGMNGGPFRCGNWASS